MTPATIRILHVSDLHARKSWELDQRRVVEAFIADVDARQNERRVDLIVMSGDLAWAGKAEEFELARELILDPLGAVTGLSADRIVLVPGNHDVDRSEIDSYSEMGWSAACVERDGSTRLMDDPAALARACQRLAAWDDFCTRFYAGTAVRRIAPLATVHEIRIDGISLGIAALNSTWRAGGDQDKGNLLLGERQVVAALAALNGVDLPVVVLHHPPDWLYAYDGDLARTEFAARGALVLTGHEHMTDPMSVKSVRGEIVYSRAGSLFGSFGYTNAYSLIDLEPREHRAAFSLRTWWVDRRLFDESADVAARGQISLDWPVQIHRAPGIPLRYSAVVATLTDRVEVHSALADRVESHQQFDDLVVPPRFLPARYREAAAAIALDPRQRLDRSDPIAELSEARVLIVAGEPEAGVSTALLWVLKHSFDTDTVRAPVFTTFDDRFGKTQFDRAASRFIRSYGGEGHRSSLPPLLVAIDDVDPALSQGLTRLLELISQRPDDQFVLGCRDEDYDALSRALSVKDMRHKSAFIAPFGRREIRELHLRLVGPEKLELVERVVSVVGTESLPRNPFVLSALVAVLADHQDVTSLNESGVLQGYVDLLLSDALPDLEKLGMDKRRREHLLASLAASFTASETRTMHRLDVEAYLQDYFRSRGWLSASPGKVLESLIRRRILTYSGDDVAFRHPALFHLFQGAAYHAHADFAASLRADALSHLAALRHAAGLERNDRDLLEYVLELADQRITDVGGVDLSVYDPNPATLDEMMDTLNAELDAATPWPSGVELEQQLDHLDDMQAGRDGASVSPAPPETHALGRAVSLLSQVLRNTELSTDLDLKQRALRSAARGWAILGVLIAEHADSGGLSRELTQRLARLAGVTVSDELIDKLVPIVSEFMRHILAAGIAIGMSEQIASQHLEAVVQTAAEDDEFMAEPVIAFLITMLYGALGRPDWPQRLESTYLRHADHQMLATALRAWALYKYRATTNPAEARELEAVLSRIYGETTRRLGPGAAIARGRSKSEVLAKLRSLRSSAQRAIASAGSTLDPLDSDVAVAAIETS